MGKTNLDTLELSEGLEVNATEVLDSTGLMPVSQVKVVSSSGTITSPVFQAFVTGSVVKPLLDGNTNTVWTAPANTIVINVAILNFSGAGSAGTVDLGIDDTWDTGSADQDGWIAAADINTFASTVMSLKDEANQTALSAGMSTTTGGPVTITASTDLSASDWNGAVAITYFRTA